MKYSTTCSKSWTDVNINFKTRRLGHCCISTYHEMPDTLKPDYFANNEGIQKRRSDSLKGIMHPDCVRCWRDIETNNIPFKNGQNKWSDFSNAKPDVPQVRYIEMEMDNICDLSCLYCSPRHSSKIAQEEGKVVTSKTTEEDFNVFKDWLTDTVNNADHEIDIAFLGGEPTASKAFYSMIDHISSLDNMRGEILLTTNGNTKEYLFNKMLDTMSKTQLEWAIHLSNESFKNDSNLIRYGLDWDTFESNLHAYAQHPKVSRIIFDVAMTNLALPSFPQYINWALDIMSEYNKPFHITGGPVTGPKELDIAILPDYFKKYIDQTTEIIQDKKLKNHNSEKSMHYLKILHKRIGSVHKHDYIDIIEGFLKKKQEFKKTDKLLGLLRNLEIKNV